MNFDDDWDTTADEHIGRNKHDGSFHFSHETGGEGGPHGTFEDAQDALGFEVIHELVSRG